MTKASNNLPNEKEDSRDGHQQPSTVLYFTETMTANTLPNAMQKIIDQFRSLNFWLFSHKVQ